MSQLAREELAEILFQEIGTYLPNIQRGITDLYLDGGNEEVLYEVHRLFHNIKGAASQVAFLSLSRTAAVCEAVSASMLDQKDSPVERLDFLASTTSGVEEFCKLEDKSQDAEEMLFAMTAVSFLNLSGEGIEIPESLREAILEGSALLQENKPVPAGGTDEFAAEMQRQCLMSLRPVLPLLSEFTGYLSRVGTAQLPQRILHPLSDAVETLADCSLAAGLSGQYRLLSDFHLVIRHLLEDPSLFSEQMQDLLREFVEYLDIVFSLDPVEGEQTIARIQSTVSGLVDSLLQGGKGVNALDVLNQDDFEEDYIPEFFPADDSLDDEESLDFWDDTVLAQDLSTEFGESEAAVVVDDEDELPVPPDMNEPFQDRSEEDELLDIFQAECEEHLQAIGHELNTLEGQVRGEMALSPELQGNVSSMRRAVHTLKGAAAMTGFDVLAGCAHSLEDLLDWLNDQATSISGEDVVVIAQAVDVIEALGANPNVGGDDAERVIALVKNHMAALSTSTEKPEELEPQAEVLAPEPSVDPEPVQMVEPESAEPPVELEVAVAEQAEIEVVDSEDDEQEVTGNVRVRLGDLDELAAIEGELIVARGSIEKQLENFTQSLGNLGNVKESLQRKSQELEVGFEAQSLYGFGAAGKPVGPLLEEVAVPTNPEFDPIELDQYSQLNLIIRSLNEISSDMNALHAEMVSLCTGMRGQVAKQQLAMGVMQEKLLRIRMTPFSTITRMLFRTVRQTAAGLQKDVRLSITGEDVYMDRYIWSKTLDPLMHILRNCVDHGIEDAETRVAAGKPATGQITIDALQRSRNVILRISDDGCGVDISTLREKLLAENLISTADEYSDEDLLPFLFQPSISTKKDISTISGRGVGLDVVVKNIKELRGTVQMSSRPGQGVSFELSIPITLSVNRAIVVDVGGASYAIPLQDVVEVRKYPSDQVFNEPFLSVTWRGEKIKVLELSSMLTTSGSGMGAESAIRLMLIVDTGSEYVALQADRVIEQREIVIKDLGSHLRYVRGISGVTLTGEGTVIPILNLVELANEDGVDVTTVVADAEEAVARTVKQANQVLVVDDSISVRHAISRLLESRSWVPTQAVDGLDALEKLESFTPDIIIVDIEMPRMNGYEFMSVLRSDERRRSIPVVMLTSRASEKHRKKLLSLVFSTM